jgi:octaprenyl-diphosphate synthase
LSQPFDLPAEFNPSEIGKAILAEAMGPVQDDLDILRPKLVSYLFTETESSKTLIEYVFLAQGKLIRPALFFLVCRILKYDGPYRFPIAAVCEYVHTASLLHDDVIDNSTTRRNKPTSNHIWGDETAVLVGDLIYSTASEMMAATGSLDLVKTFAAAIRKMSEGELMQLENLFKPEMDEQTYFKILECKTGILIGACCRAAGILAEANDTVLQKLEQFGQALGMAFQLVDDALDYLGSAQTVGKDVLLDLQEGKLTMPVLLLKERMNQDEQTHFRNLIKQDPISEEGLAWISEHVDRYQTAEQTLIIAGEYSDRALDILRHELPPGEANEHLEAIVSALLLRKH